MDSLRNDLRGVQAALKELLDKVESPLQVPSWRFPEKLASSLNTDEVLKRELPQGEDSHVLLLELVLDRLLFMFQCCLQLSDQCTGQRSAKPLTLASTAKKFSKRFAQDMRSAEQLRSKLAISDEKLADQESALIKLQTKCSSLQEALSTVSSSGSTTSVSLPERQDSQHSGMVDPAVKHGDTPLRPSSSCVPYEAEGTLKMNRLTMTSQSMLYIKSSTTEKNSSSKPDTAHKRIPVADEGQNITTLPHVKNQVSVCVQTMDTAFALCVHCTETQHTLVGAAKSISEACSQHNLNSDMGATDWNSPAQLELEKWSTAFYSDLRNLDTYCSEVEKHYEQLNNERDQQRKIITDLEFEIQALGVQMDSLRASTEDIQKNSEYLLAANREVFEAQTKQLEHAQGKLEMKNKTLKEELHSTRKQEAHLRALVADLEHRRGQLEQKLHRTQTQEVHLQSAKHELESELNCLQLQLGQCQKQLEEERVELSKSQELCVLLERNHKTLQAEQASLYADRKKQSQLYDKQYLELLRYKEQSERLERTFQCLQDECASLKEMLGTAKSELTDSHLQHEKLCGAISELEERLAQVDVELKKEQHRCRLLMDYPFIKQTSADYATHITSLTSKESQKQVSANTIRILLLEEQNAELRNKLVKLAREYHSPKPEANQLQHPTPIWRNELLLQVNKEQKAARDKGSEILPASNHLKKAYGTTALDTTRKSRSATTMSSTRKDYAGNSVNQKANDSFGNSSGKLRSSSGSKLKRRLGHLVSAIAEAHKTSSGRDLPTGRGGLASSETPPSLSPHFRNQVWDDPGTSVNATSCLETESSLGGSYSNIEVHMCSKCDRMYHTVDDLKLHHMICKS